MCYHIVCTNWLMHISIFYSLFSLSVCFAIESPIDLPTGDETRTVPSIADVHDYVKDGKSSIYFPIYNGKKRNTTKKLFYSAHRLAVYCFGFSIPTQCHWTPFNFATKFNFMGKIIFHQSKQQFSRLFRRIRRLYSHHRVQHTRAYIHWKKSRRISYVRGKINQSIRGRWQSAVPECMKSVATINKSVKAALFIPLWM